MAATTLMQTSASNASARPRMPGAMLLQGTVVGCSSVE